MRPSQKAPAERLVADTYEKFIGPWPISTKGNEWCSSHGYTITAKDRTIRNMTYVCVGKDGRKDVVISQYWECETLEQSKLKLWDMLEVGELS
jgi:hypothetical protein